MISRMHHVFKRAALIAALLFLSMGFVKYGVLFLVAAQLGG